MLGNLKELLETAVTISFIALLLIFGLFALTHLGIWLINHIPDTPQEQAQISQDPDLAISPDQCLRTKLFQGCLKALPAGPQSTRYNDWDEVVNACSVYAYKSSIRKVKYIPAECRVNN